MSCPVTLTNNNTLFDDAKLSNTLFDDAKLSNTASIIEQLLTIINLEIHRDEYQPPRLRRLPNNTQIDAAVFELMITCICPDECNTSGKYKSFYAKNQKYYVYDACYFGWHMISIDQSYAIRLDTDISSMLERIIGFERTLPFFKDMIESNAERDMFFPTNKTISKYIRKIIVNLTSGGPTTCASYYQSICRQCSSTFMYYVYKSRDNSWWIVNTSHQYAKNIDSLVTRALVITTPIRRIRLVEPSAPKKRRHSNTDVSEQCSKKIDFD